MSTIQCHIVFIEGGKCEYLLLKRSSKAKIYANMWQVVTGKIEQSEKAFRAAYRESEEETKLEFSDFWHVPYIGSFYDIRSDAIQNIPVFALRAQRKNVVLSLEHDAYEWLSYEDCLKKLSLPSHIEGTKILKKHIVDELDREYFKIYI